MKGERRREHPEGRFLGTTGERPGEEAAVAPATTWEAGGGRDLGEICASALSLPGRS